MTRKTTDNTGKNLQKEDVQGEGENNYIAVKDAAELWAKKYPECPITFQTLRNWAKKFEFGKKRNSILSRSLWKIDRDKFKVFLKDPRKFLESKRETK